MTNPITAGAIAAVALSLALFAGPTPVTAQTSTSPTQITPAATGGATSPQRVSAAARGTLRVGSYNILCANCRSWGPRRKAVAATIRAQRVAVVGLQEASNGRLSPGGRTQFEDLLTLLPGYRAVNAVRYNCERGDRASRCEPRDRGASGAVRILYNPRKLSLLDQGSRQLADLPGTAKDRFVAWAVFRHKASGKRFLFTNTHLEPRNDAAGSTEFYRIRREQARMVADTIAAHRRGLPVIAVGDFNSTKWDTPSNAPYDVMLGAGLVDPLGNSYRSVSKTRGATVKKRIHTQYASYNKYLRKARKTNGPNGSNPDYIFTSKMRVPEYETVVRLNRSGRYVGVIPSDHNMLRATVRLP